MCVMRPHELTACQDDLLFLQLVQGRISGSDTAHKEHCMCATTGAAPKQGRENAPVAIHLVGKADHDAGSSLHVRPAQFLLVAQTPHWLGQQEQLGKPRTTALALTCSAGRMYSASSVTASTVTRSSPSLGMTVSMAIASSSAI